jgi:serine protease Do
MPAGIGEIAEQLRRSTVQVRVDEGRSGSGSGVIWDQQGRIVSNAHVVRGSLVEVEFWDGEVVRAKVLRRDARRDLALVSVDRKSLPAPRWADSNRLTRGEEVLAVGNPLGFIGALSTGVLRAVGPMQGLGPQSWVQAQIRLAPGNSGGAMADATGAVVGINTMVAGPLGLAVPSNDVAKFVGRAGRTPVLGVTIEPAPIRIASKLAMGLRIQHVAPQSKAERASLLAGDVIIGVDGEFFSSPEELEDRLLKGGLVRLEFLRGGKPVPREVNIELGPQDEGRLQAAA